MNAGLPAGYTPVLMQRTPTDDHALFAKALIAAITKARELGWIV